MRTSKAAIGRIVEGPGLGDGGGAADLADLGGQKTGDRADRIIGPDLIGLAVQRAIRGLTGNLLTRGILRQADVMDRNAAQPVGQMP